MGRTSATRLLAVILIILAWGVTHSSATEEGGREKPALDVPYEPTTPGIAAEMIRMAEVTSRDLVYDLGCGDGRIVIMAAKERGARGVGVDLDPERIKESKENAKRAGVSHLVRFYEQDLFETNIRDATVVMLYLWPAVNLRLRPKLLTELKPGTRIVSHSHTMADWEADVTRTVEGDSLYFFLVPANATGTWQWVSQEGTRTVLQLTQKFQKVRGSMTVGDKRFFVTEGSLKGDTLTFEVDNAPPGSKEVLSFEGRISGDNIEGRIMQGGTGRGESSWRATRDASTMVPIAE